MCKYSIEDLKSINAREFRAVPTGNWITTRNGKRKMETEGKEYISTKHGKIEVSEWFRYMENAIENEGKQELLKKIEAYVKQHCAWLHKDKEIHEYALECLSDAAYLYWPEFETAAVRQNNSSEYKKEESVK